MTLDIEKIKALTAERDEWRKDCHTYHDAMLKREDQLEVLRAERDKLKAVLKRLWLAAPSEVQCRNMHHPKPKQHRYDETCELVSEYLEAIVDAQEALKESA